MRNLFVLGVLMVFFSTANSQVVWGTNNTRTEFRDNAGLQGNAGAASGFFETALPVNYPSNATSWWHLLDVRHNNPANNFAMQFSGSFFDQNLYFRKTNDNAAQPWSRVLLESSEGRVGIGTTDPLNALHIQRNELFVATTIESLQDGYAGLELKSGNKIWQWSKRPTNENDALGLYYRDQNNNWSNCLTVTPTGNMGLGINSPSNKLEVNGNIRSKKVIVTQSNWPDYVFSPSYKLPSLDSIAVFIKTNKHLPEMPSATTVEKDGQDVGEIQKQLLKKMEEMTLYIIEQNKQIQQLQKEVLELRQAK